MDQPEVPYKNEKKVADLYGTIRLVQRGDGYFFIEQPRDPDDWNETHDVVCFSDESARKIHAALGNWLTQTEPE